MTVIAEKGKISKSALSSRICQNVQPALILLSVAGNISYLGNRKKNFEVTAQYSRRLSQNKLQQLVVTFDQYQRILIQNLPVLLFILISSTSKFLNSSPFAKAFHNTTDTLMP
jgi:hypothetical protein